MTSLLWTYIILWTIIYAIAYTKKIKKYEVPIDPHTSSFKLKYFVYFQYETTRWTKWVQDLTNRQSPKLLKIWFDIGIYIAGIFFFAALVMISISAWTTLSDIFVNFSRSSTQTIINNSLHKRDFQSIRPEDNPHGPSRLIIPAIPGLTLPIDHLPFFMIALAVCAISHELAHAVAAIYEKTLVNSMGIIMIGLFPGAFVNIDLKGLSPKARLRIVSAGIWHNVVVGTIFYLILISNMIPLVMRVVGYRDLRGMDGGGGGVVVIDVNYGSPLYNHLSISSIITRLDDNELINSIDSYSSYLSQLDDDEFTNMGYCMDRDLIKLNGDISCCDQNSGSMDVCFKIINRTISSNSMEYVCIPPQKVLVEPNQPRCVSKCNNPNQLCVKPGSEIVRIYYKSPEYVEVPKDQKEESVVLYYGSRQSILDTLRVGYLAPRTRYHPVKFPYLISTLCHYILSFSFAFAILNSLPILRLDGSEMLSAFMDMTAKKSVEEIDLGTQTSNILFLSKRWMIPRALRIYASICSIIVLIGTFKSLL